MPGSSAEQWAKRVERWKDSGLTTKEFAAETGLNASTLAYWRWKLKSSESEESPRAKKRMRASERAPTRKAARSSTRSKTTPSASWIELPLASVTGAAVLELVVRDDVRLRIPSGVDEDTLTRVVRALGVAP